MTTHFPQEEMATRLSRNPRRTPGGTTAAGACGFRNGARRLGSMALALALLSWGSWSWAQNGTVVQEKVGAGGGYRVIKVWGSYQEMGHAQGYLLAEDILAGIAEVKALASAQGTGVYQQMRLAVQAMTWRSVGVEEELTGMVEGIKEKVRGATVDVADLKVINTVGDWLYTVACRSHSTWGSMVQGETKTLSTRRLDFSLPPGITLHHNHVVLARLPDSGVRWLNLAFPGYVVSVTGVNEYGTLSALHDYLTTFSPGAHMSRAEAVRHALTLVGDAPLNQHLDLVYADLSQDASVATGTFINYYVPEGLGGVVTCPSGGACTKKRVPQDDYYGGEVLLTTNAETDGHGAPPDDTFMDAYYAAGGPKALADHYQLMKDNSQGTHDGLHLLTVGYRSRGDMTIWAEGRTATGITETIKLEWDELFAAETAQKDAGAEDAGAAQDAGTSASPDSSAGGTGDLSSGGSKKKDDGCAVAGDVGGGAAAGWLVWLLGLVAIRRPRRTCVLKG